MIAFSQRVRAVDFRQDWYRQRCRELNVPTVFHRKYWEFAIIADVALQHGLEMYAHPFRALGFGVGAEPIPAWLAGREATVVATDAPSEGPWKGQHAASIDALTHKGLCTDRQLEEFVTFRPVDMNAIPEDLLQGQFDLTWSCGSFEHIGSVEQCLTFFCTQMRALRPGGLAVHTTEFNPDSTRPTMDRKHLCLFREQELRDLEARLLAQGDRLWPLDLTEGGEVADRHVAKDAADMPHLSLALGGGYTTTSILLVAQRVGGE